MAATQCGARPTQTGQLVERLMGLDHGPKNKLKERETGALVALSRSMLRLFVDDPSPDLSCVLEASALSPFADHDTYQELFEAFVNVIAHGTSDFNLLNPQVLKAFDLVLRSPESLKSGIPLVSALKKLQTRLESAVADANGRSQHRLLCTLSAVLDNMNEIKSSGLSQDDIHKPLLEQLDGLSKNPELRLAQAAQYAYQALLGIPSDESPWKTLWLQFYPVVKAAAQVSGSVFSLDPSKLVEGLEGLQHVVPLVESIVNVIRNLSGLSGSISSATKGIKTLRKQKSWYVTLRFTNMLIHSNATSHLEKLLPKVPCVEEKEFLCGLCAQLEQAWNTGRSLREGVIPVLKDFLIKKGQHTEHSRVQEWIRLVACTPGQTNSEEHVKPVRRKLFSISRKKRYLSTIEFSQIQDEPLPGKLLNRAWSSCDEARVFYADLAILEHYTSSKKNLLRIERLTGKPLSMDQCYINLATVTITAGDASGSEKRAKRAIPSQFSLLSRMKVEEPPKTSQYTLPELFKRDKNNKVSPKRILIRGQAGVGKSTLCKKMVHDYIHEYIWSEFFDRVLWVPLRKLKGKSRLGYNLERFLREEYLSESSDVEDLTKALWNTIRHNNDRTLFILDGLDEVSQDLNSQSHDFLLELLNQGLAIITSRPYGINESAINNIDLPLETIGFYPDQVDEYIQKNAHNNAAEIRAFVEEHWIIQGLARIPIQLDALCYCWGDSPSHSNDVPTTMTTLYKAVERSLWDKDIEQLEKTSLGNFQPLSKTDAHKALPTQILSLVQGEINALQTLAFTGLYSNVVEFDVQYQNDVLTPQNGILPSTGSVVWCNDLGKLSFLRTSDIDPSSGSNYHFLHLTYQEYFAAQYFVEHWKSDKKFVCLNLQSGKKESIEPEAFLRREKYKAGYDIMWRFVSGLLQAEKKYEDLCRFFKVIEAEPHDLLGPAHQRLSMHCFSEVTQLNEELELYHLRESMEHKLSQWLLFECKSSGEIQLGREMECPDHLLNPLLQRESEAVIVLRALRRRSRISLDKMKLAASWLKNDSSKDLKEAAFEMLVHHHKSLPENMLSTLISSLEDSDPDVRSSMVYVLILQSNLSEAILQALISLLKDNDLQVKSYAAWALINQSNLPEAIIQSLVSLLKDNNPDVISGVVRALGRQSNLSEAIIQSLVSLLKDNNPDVISGVVRTLGRQSNLSEAIIQSLVSLLKDNNPGVILEVVHALGRQSNLSEATIQALVSLLGDENPKVKLSAAFALRNKSNLSEAIVKVLISLLKHGDSSVRRMATLALHYQSILSEAILQALIQLLKDDDIGVGIEVAIALGSRSNLPEAIVQSLVSLLKDINPDVISEVVHALSGQSNLSETIIHALVSLLGDNNPSVRSNATRGLIEQSNLPKVIIQTLVSLLEDEDPDVRRRAAHALSRQSNLSEAITQTLVSLLENTNSDERTSVINVLGQQSTLSKGVVKALAMLLHDEQISNNIEEVLRHYKEFYSILPELNVPCLKSLFAVWARRSFREQFSCYLWEDYLHIDTPEGLRRVRFTGMVERAIQGAQEDWNIRFQKLTAESE